MNGGRHLAHAREGCGSVLDGILSIACGGWIEGGVETVEEEGVEDLEHNVHVK